MNAIFAVNSANGFGTGTDMPWPRSSVDLKRFKEITSGHTVVMGSNTWKSNMPKPLPNRRNIVLSKTLNDHRCEIFSNVQAMMMETLQSEQVFVIGGTQVLWTLRPFINKIYLTKFKSSDHCDVMLDIDKYTQEFNFVSGEIHDDHVFQIYEK